MALLPTVIDRAEALAIDAGAIVLIPKNGDQTTADKWLKDNHDQLLVEILGATGKQAYLYDGYSTGCYGARKAGGVTLQFINPVSGQEAFTVFNAEVKRTRTTKHGKKGTMLPPGHFNIGKRAAFVSLWSRVGLPLPRRLSEFHDCMGKLRNVVLTGTADHNGKIDKTTLNALSISFEEIRDSLSSRKSPDNYPAKSRQLPGNYPARTPDKVSPLSQEPRGIEPNLTTGGFNHVERLTGTRVKVIPLSPPLPPEEQSIDDWLDDYAEVSG